MSSTVKVGATRVSLEFIRAEGHREAKGGTKINCYLKENQSDFLETHRLKDLEKETLRVRHKKGTAFHNV